MFLNLNAKFMSIFVFVPKIPSKSRGCVIYANRSEDMHDCVIYCDRMISLFACIGGNNIPGKRRNVHNKLHVVQCLITYYCFSEDLSLSLRFCSIHQRYKMKSQLQSPYTDRPFPHWKNLEQTFEFI